MCSQPGLVESACWAGSVPGLSYFFAYGDEELFGVFFCFPLSLKKGRLMWQNFPLQPCGKTSEIYFQEKIAYMPLYIKELFLYWENYEGKRCFLTQTSLKVMQVKFKCCFLSALWKTPQFTAGHRKFPSCWKRRLIKPLKLLPIIGPASPLRCFFP